MLAGTSRSRPPGPKSSRETGGLASRRCKFMGDCSSTNGAAGSIKDCGDGIACRCRRRVLVSESQAPADVARAGLPGTRLTVHVNSGPTAGGSGAMRLPVLPGAIQTSRTQSGSAGASDEVRGLPVVFAMDSKVASGCGDCPKMELWELGRHCCRGRLVGRRETPRRRTPNPRWL